MVKIKLHGLARKKCVPLRRRVGSSFHDLRAFNLALLAKQGWRLQIGSHGSKSSVLS